MESFEYGNPGSVSEAVAMLGARWGEADVLAGPLLVDGAKVAVVTSKDPDSLEVIRHSTAHLLAAAHMGNGIDEAAVQERQPHRGEGGLDAVAVSAVTVEQGRVGGILFEIFAIDQRQRDFHAIGRGGVDPFGDVVGRVEAAQNRLAFDEGEGSGTHVVVEGSLGRGQRGIGQAQERCVIVAGHLRRERVDGFGQRHVVFQAAGELADANVRQGVEALGDDQKFGEGVDRFDGRLISRWDLLAPILSLGILNGSRDEAEVAR